MAYDIMLDSLTQLAWGKQTNLATAAARTALMTFTTAPLTWDLQRYRFAGTRGRRTVAPAAFTPVTVRDRATMAIASELNFRDLLIPLLSGIDAAPTEATPGSATNARTLTFNPAATVTPEISYFTLERRTSDAKATPGKVAYQIPKGFSTGFTIASTGSEVATMVNNMQLGQHSRLATETAGLAEPDVPILAPTMLTTFGIYDSWADMVAGTPGVSDTYDYNITYVSGHNIVERNAGVFDYDEEQGGERTLGLTCTVYASSLATDLAEDEVTHLTNNDARFVKIRLKSATEIESGFPYQIDIGMACTHGDNSLTTRDNVGPNNLLVRDFDFTPISQQVSSVERDIYVQVQLHDDMLTAFGI